MTPYQKQQKAWQGLEEAMNEFAPIYHNICMSVHPKGKCPHNNQPPEGWEQNGLEL